jgi:sigma-B regulation protein RsbU (phosphoserine phosphatase)
MPPNRQLPTPNIAPPVPASIFRPMPSTTGNFHLLQAHRLLKGIPAGVLEALVEKCERIALGRDEVLLRPGQANHTLYFLLSGQLEVYLDSRDSGQCFPIEAGEVVGEMSVIEHRPVAAWVVGKEPSLLLAMPEKVFWDELLLIPQATRNLLRMLISRVRKTDAVVVKELEKKVRYEHLQRELKSAAKIQTSILPSARPLFPNHPQIQVHALMRPAREVGGDFFDAIAINDHSVCVAVGDVCGKGMPAALFMVRVITLLRMCVLQEQNPAAILPAVNRLLYEANEESMFVTLAAAIVDTRTGRLTYLNGGHNPPFLALNGQPFQTWTPPTAPLLGFDPDAIFSATELTLQPGDTLVLYSDGVPEAENSALKQFTVERAAEALTESMASGDVVRLVDGLAASVDSFAGEQEQSDDITILALRYLGDAGRPAPSRPRRSNETMDFDLP